MPNADAIIPQSRLKLEGLSQRVYESIKENILDLGLKPNQRLTMDQLAKDLGVSISPVREALARLFSERLVAFKPYSGYVVAPMPSVRYFYDLLDARVMLEGRAVELGAERADAKSLQALKRAVTMMGELPLGPRYRDYAKFNSWDFQFHHALVASSHNQVLIEMFDNLHAHLQLSRLYVQLGIKIDNHRVMEDHRAILNAFDAGSGSKARQAIEAHLTNARKMVDLWQHKVNLKNEKLIF